MSLENPEIFEPSPDVPVPDVDYEAMFPNGRKLVIVANATPVRFDDDGILVPSSGGLATGVNPALRAVPHGLWIGHEAGYAFDGNGNGSADETSGLYDALGLASEDLGFAMDGVAVEDEPYNLYYRVFSNSVLWPLFHGFGTFAQEQFDNISETRDAWDAYNYVNKLFVQKTKEKTDGDDMIWVQDYHFLLFAKQFREEFPDRHNPINFFLHIPFPSVAELAELDEQFRIPLLEGLLAYDQIGFHIGQRDIRNFIAAVQEFLPQERYAIHAITNNDPDEIGISFIIHDDESDHRIKVGAFPISINHKKFANPSDEMQEKIDREAAQLIGDMMLFTAGRADYTKGMPETIAMLDRLFQIRPNLKGELHYYFQFGRTRKGVDHEDQVYKRIFYGIKNLNTKHGTENWQPIIPYDGNLPRYKLLAHFQKALLGIYPSLADGMALVPIENIAASRRADAAIMIGKDAGAALHLPTGKRLDREKGHHAVAVDARATEAFAHQVLRVIDMSDVDRVYHLRQLKQAVVNHTVDHWLAYFMQAADLTAARYITLAEQTNTKS